MHLKGVIIMSDNAKNEGFYDSVGGYHDSGIGYSPTGEWCGERCKSSCENCPVAKSLAE